MKEKNDVICSPPNVRIVQMKNFVNPKWSLYGWNLFPNASGLDSAQSKRHGEQYCWKTEGEDMTVGH